MGVPLLVIWLTGGATDYGVTLAGWQNNRISESRRTWCGSSHTCGDRRHDAAPARLSMLSGGLLVALAEIVGIAVLLWCCAASRRKALKSARNSVITLVALLLLPVARLAAPPPDFDRRFYGGWHPSFGL